MTKISLLLLILMCHALFSTPGQAQTKNEIPLYTYAIVNSFPHDHQAYTQGLVYYNGYFYESTGRHGESSLRKVEIKTGAPLQIHRLDEMYFGEGITLFNDRIIQLTWQAFTGFVYDRKTLLPMEEFYYNTEGWGITNDGKQLIMSDGSANLYFLEPETFAVSSQIQVTADGIPVRNLNELEYVNGEILANVMPSDRIARINPASGKITAWIDLSGILRSLREGYAVDVLNGIAYDDQNDRLFVTGKLWPKVYEIRIIPAARK